MKEGKNGKRDYVEGITTKIKPRMKYKYMDRARMERDGKKEK